MIVSTMYCVFAATALAADWASATAGGAVYLLGQAYGVCGAVERAAVELRKKEIVGIDAGDDEADRDLDVERAVVGGHDGAENRRY